MARPRQDEAATEGLGGRANVQAERKKWLVFGDFETMDTEPARVACSPKRLPWCENLIIVANNDLRAVPAAGSVLATMTGETPIAAYFAFFNSHDYLVVFCASGAAYTVDVATGTKVNFATAGTFSSGPPQITQWEDQRILIADATAGYCTYDGTNFIVAGQASPNLVITNGGKNYGSAPTVTISGGSGSGATATAVIDNGEVSELTLTAGGSGFAPGDSLLVSFSGGTPDPGGVQSITILDPGHDYRSAPTITIAAPAGGGTTATATATVSLGTITGITVTQMGTGYKETPAITITPAGADVDAGGAVLTPVMTTVASATARIWPQGQNPTSIAVWQGRVWMSVGRVINYTGLLGYDDMDEANAAGSTTLSDADVIHSITKLMSANNFLFLICDQSIKQIGQINVSGTITNFTVTSLSSDQGSIFPGSVISYERSVVFTNQVGVYGVLGASVGKISAPMTGLFETVDFALPPISDVFDFYGHHTLLTLVRFNDPDNGTTRALLMAYYNKRWSVISQGDGISYIVTAHLADAERIFALNGNQILEILSDKLTAVPVKIRAALSHNGEPQINKLVTHVGIGQSSSEPNDVNVKIESESGSNSFAFASGQAINFVNNSNQVIQFVNTLGDPITFITGGFVFYDTLAAETSGIYLGATITGNFSGYHFNNIVIEYKYGALLKSKNTL